MVETAKENGLNPYAYLKHLLEQLPNIDLENPDELDRLMPGPVSCKHFAGVANLVIRHRLVALARRARFDAYTHGHLDF